MTAERYTQRIYWDLKDPSFLPPSSDHLKCKGIDRYATLMLWHNLRIKIYKSFQNNHLQTLFLKLTSGILPTLYNKHIRYPTVYEHFTYLYCELALDK